MTKAELITAMEPFLATFGGADLTDTQWGQYHLALAGLNPGDLDDAMADLRRTHAYRNAPLPAELLTAAQAARRRRGAGAEADDQPRRHCARCRDTGWVSEMVMPPAGLYAQPVPHEYLSRCHCIATNPILQAQRQRYANYAAKASGRE